MQEREMLPLLQMPASTAGRASVQTEVLPVLQQPQCVFYMPQKGKKRLGHRLAEQSRAGWCLLATPTRASPMLLWKSTSVRQWISPLAAQFGHLSGTKTFQLQRVYARLRQAWRQPTFRDLLYNEGRFLSVILTPVFVLVVCLFKPCQVRVILTFIHFLQVKLLCSIYCRETALLKL